MSDKILNDFSKFIKEELNKKDIKFITSVKKQGKNIIFS